MSNSCETGSRSEEDKAAKREIILFAFYSPSCYSTPVAKWCTVTVTESDGRRHSLDVQATSTFDAAHLYVTEAKKERAVGFPKLTLATVFEVVAEGGSIA